MKEFFETNIEIPDDSLIGVSYRDRVPKFLEEILRKMLLGPMGRTKELEEKLEVVQNFKPADRTCPICGGVMYDLTPLLNLSLKIGEHEVNQMLSDRDDFGSIIPKQWECSKCGGIDIRQADLEKKKLKDQGKASFGAALQKFNPTVEEIHGLKNSYQEGWVLRIEEEWFFIHGLRQRAEEAIGMKEIDWAENERRGQEWLKRHGKIEP